MFTYNKDQLETHMQCAEEEYNGLHTPAIKSYSQFGGELGKLRAMIPPARIQQGIGMLLG
jgi:hypothetical protein